MMNSSSPAHSSISTTAVVGGGGGGGSNAALSSDDFHFPCDPMSTHERKDEAMIGYLLLHFALFTISFQNLCVISGVKALHYILVVMIFMQN